MGLANILEAISQGNTTAFCTIKNGMKKPLVLPTLKLNKVLAMFAAWANTKWRFTMKFDEFTMAYIECALWSTNDESDESGGVPLDDNYTWEDIDPETLNKMVKDCQKFQADNQGIVPQSLAIAGHDFWLTRNGHGAGFWDGDWPEPQASQLSKAAEAFGGFNLYVGDSRNISH